MALVSIRINGRDYSLACDDGQEDQLIALGAEVDDRIRQIARQAPHAGDVMLFLLASVMLADELADNRRQLRQSNARVTRLEERLAGAQEPQAANKSHESESKLLVETLKDVTDRIEKIAETLELS